MVGKRFTGFIMLFMIVELVLLVSLGGYALLLIEKNHELAENLGHNYETISELLAQNDLLLKQRVPDAVVVNDPESLVGTFIFFKGDVLIACTVPQICEVPYFLLNTTQIELHDMFSDQTFSFNAEVTDKVEINMEEAHVGGETMWEIVVKINDDWTFHSGIYFLKIIVPDGSQQTRGHPNWPLSFSTNFVKIIT